MNKQDFSEIIKSFANSVNARKDTCQTEEATKMSLIVPLFQILGYDVFNPLEFCPEYTADIGIKKGEKVDYAILIKNEPHMLIECKGCNEVLDSYTSQLYRYFGASKAKYGIFITFTVRFPPRSSFGHIEGIHHTTEYNQIHHRSL